MSVQHFEVVSFEPWKDGVVRIRIACDEPEGRVCHTFYARQEDYDDRVNELDTHAAEVARLTARLDESKDAILKTADEMGRQTEKRDTEIARLRGALEFYSQEDRYHGPNQPRLEGDRFTPEDNPYRTDVLRDGGRIARAALAPAARKDPS